MRSALLSSYFVNGKKKQKNQQRALRLLLGSHSEQAANWGTSQVGWRQDPDSTTSQNSLLSQWEGGVHSVFMEMFTVATVCQQPANY